MKMFRSCLAITIIAVLFFVQVYSEDVESRNDVDDLLEELRQVVNQTYVPACAAVSDTFYNIEVAIASKENETLDAINSIQDQYNGKLDDIKLTATDAGTDIDGCLGDNEQLLMNISNKYSENLLREGANFFGEELSYSLLTIMNIYQLRDEVDEIEIELNRCEYSQSPEDCVDNLAVKIQEDIVRIPKMITEEADKYLEEAPSRIPEIEDIASSVLDEIDTEGNDLLTIITECVENL